MAGSDYLVNAFTTLLVTLDPPGLAPLFLSLTVGMSTAQRREVAIRASVIAFAILGVFALVGASILDALGISMGAFRIAGGLLLFAIAFEMIFERRNERKERAGKVAITEDHIRNVAVFPLAIPLIAGPGAISATVLIGSTLNSFAGKAQLIGVVAVTMLLVFLALSVAERLNALLGVTGRALLTRLLGVLLAALSVQFVLDGLRSAFAL